MRTLFSKIALAATLGLALAFTLSCGLHGTNGEDETKMCGGKEYDTSEFSCVDGELVGKSSSSKAGSSSSGGGKSSSGGDSFVGEKGTFKDARDDQEYKWVKIGTQTWMAENLNYFEEWVGPTRGNKCYNNKDENCKKYGRLYEWDDAIRLCPDGWHLPTDAEWDALISAVGKDAGKKLKSVSSDWREGAGTDAYGFGALPGGALIDKEFQSINIWGVWWTAKENGYGDSYSKWMGADNDVGESRTGDWANKTNQFSIRCVSGYSSSSSITYGKITDKRDNKEYKTVKIGTQTWMAENLNFAEKGMCYNNKETNCNKYGRLYDWATAMDVSEDYNDKEFKVPPGQHQGICPDGWHLPTSAEWNSLADYVGGNPGKKLKARNNEWKDDYGTDTYGFGALPGGVLIGKEFQDINVWGCWWTAKENGGDWAYSKWMGVDNDVGESRNGDWGRKTNLFSIRCVED